ncbi:MULTISPECIES: AAA family ATPase [Lacticaseibacillus]|uniref:AAA family ATPase n=1 Tax=Lacticaseibacillus TaxID=2759736 RepID=UPI00063DC28E|nr:MULTISPECIES: AAA family ATPase [Lacticaseibacillus]KLI75607.1 abortive infection protein [Lacticaseibacillus casei]
MTNPHLSFLRVDILDHPLFAQKTSFSLAASQRVPNDAHDDMTHLFGSIWINNLTTLIGRNASGKTLTMKLVMGILDLLLHQKSIGQTHLNETLMGSQPISFSVYFYGSDHFLYQDDLTIAPVPDQAKQWQVKDEKIWAKKVQKSMTRKSIFDFSKAELLMDRLKLDTFQQSLLAADDSFMRSLITQHHYQTQKVFDTFMFTNANLPFFPSSNGQVPDAILAYLDPTIDYLFIETNKHGKAFYRLKFKQDDQEITDNNFATIEYYLSSGTVKGITLYRYVVQALQSGGLIFVDELENHFNLAIVHTFMEYFANPKINQHHATLVFSTHNADLLNDLSRGDQIFITRRRQGKITLGRYSKIADRQDINRAEVFMSDYLGGTAPDYATYLKLRSQTIDLNQQANDEDLTISRSDHG